MSINNIFKILPNYTRKNTTTILGAGKVMYI